MNFTIYEMLGIIVVILFGMVLGVYIKYKDMDTLDSNVVRKHNCNSLEKLKNKKPPK